MYVAKLLQLVGYPLSGINLDVPLNFLYPLLVIVLVKMVETEFLQKFFQVIQVTSRTCTGDDWLNKLIAHLWPHVMKHITANVRQFAEDQILEMLKKYNRGTDFKLQRFTLGSNPLHIGGIEVQQSFPKRNEVVIHADIQYNSDCNILYTWRGKIGGIQDFQVQGRVKVVLGPISDSPPFVSSFLVKFLEKPVVDYRLSGTADSPAASELRHKLENYLTTKTIRFGNKRKTDSEYDERTSMSDDKPKADHKSNEVTSWYHSLFSIVISWYHSLFSIVNRMIKLFQWSSYCIFALYILSLLDIL